MSLKLNTDQNPITLPTASSTSEGLMSAADKTKLDSLTPGGVTLQQAYDASGTPAVIQMVGGGGKNVSFRRGDTQDALIIDETSGVVDILFQLNCPTILGLGGAGVTVLTIGSDATGVQIQGFPSEKLGFYGTPGVVQQSGGAIGGDPAIIAFLQLIGLLGI